MDLLLPRFLALVSSFFSDETLLLSTAGLHDSLPEGESASQESPEPMPSQRFLPLPLSFNSVTPAQTPRSRERSIRSLVPSLTVSFSHILSERSWLSETVEGLKEKVFSLGRLWHDVAV